MYPFCIFRGEGGGTLYNLQTLDNINVIEALIASALVIIGNDASREWKDWPSFLFLMTTAIALDNENSEFEDWRKPWFVPGWPNDNNQQIQSPSQLKMMQPTVVETTSTVNHLHKQKRLGW